MADAYRCEGCNRYHDGEPLYVIEPNYRTMEQPPRWEACSTGCLVDVARYLAKVHTAEGRQ